MPASSTHQCLSSTIAWVFILPIAAALFQAFDFAVTFAPQNHFGQETKVLFAGFLRQRPELRPRPHLSVGRAGVSILEVVWLQELAEDQVYEFLFMASPLKMRGATGSPVRPVAIPIRRN